MRTLFASLYTLDPDKGNSDEALDEVVKLTFDWIRSKYRRQRSSWGDSEFQIPGPGETGRPLPGHEVVREVYQSKFGSVETVTWKHPDDKDSRISWVVSTSCGVSGDVVEFHCTLGIVSAVQELAPTRITPGRPSHVAQVLDRFPARVGSWPVSTSVREVFRADVEDFVQDVLCCASRAVPVVLISPALDSGRPVVDPEDVLRDLLGVAEVVSLSDKFAAFALTDALGKGLSCYDGAIRVYWPGFSVHADHRAHPLVLRGSILASKRNGSRWSREFSRRLAALGVLAFGQSSLIRAARRQAAIEVNASRREAIAIAKREARDQSELEVELERAWDSEQRLTDQVDLLEAQVASLQAALDWGHVTPGIESDSTTVASGTHEFQSVAEAVAMAESEFRDILVFLPSAHSSAENSPFSRPEQVFDMLSAMAGVARLWKEGEGRLGNSWENKVAEHGFEFKPGISETSLAKWGDEYHFEYKGKRRLFDNHITLGAKSAQKCLSAHFLRDDEDYRLVVGWCGRHLTNTKT